MSISLTFTDLSAEEAIALIGRHSPTPTTPPAPVSAAGGMVPPPMPVSAPPVPAPAAPAAAPPPPAVPAVSGLLGQVLATMDAYVKARGQTGVADAKKVLAQVQISRPQDANEAQLSWLQQAFANTSWVP